MKTISNIFPEIIVYSAEIFSDSLQLNALILSCSLAQLIVFLLIAISTLDTFVLEFGFKPQKLSFFLVYLKMQNCSSYHLRSE